LKQRIITGVIAGAAFLGLLFLGGYGYAALILAMAAIGYYEYIRMFGLLKEKAAGILGLLLVLFLAVPWEMKAFGAWTDTHYDMALWIGAFVLLALTVISKNRFTIDQAAVVALGAIYIGFGFHFMISTRLLETGGLFFTLLAFVCVWASDAGAYFVGVKFGKTPLWPTISPKKSVEGSIGGVIIAMIAAVVFALIQPDLLSVPKALLVGFVIAVVGQFGDLIQSAYKRVKGIKDSGNILPGHGGILDRVDSWLIIFPVLSWLHLLQ